MIILLFLLSPTETEATEKLAIHQTTLDKLKANVNKALDKC